MLRKNIGFVALLALSLTRCSSAPPAPTGPDWIRQPSRTVDNGYLVYVAHAEASTSESALFRAEGIGLEDLANECSLIPKGVRVEDRYEEPTKTGRSAFVKIALEMQECEHATKANDPAEIKKIANVNFTSYLKRYQDFAETGDMPSSEDSKEIQAPSEIAAAPSQGSENTRTHFFVTRQYIAYQKEIVVLSPPQAYAAGSPESQKFAAVVPAASDHVQGLMQKDPTLRAQPVGWSHLADRPRLMRPSALSARPPTAAPAALKVPPRVKSASEPQQGANKRRRRGRHR